MPDPKNYFSFLDLADGSRWYVNDAEAREDIQRILDIIKNGSRYIGKFVSAVVGGETVSDLKEGDVPTSITTTTGTFVTGTPASGQEQLMAGDYTQIVREGKSNIELMWNGQSIDEFGSTSMLKALAFKDSVSATYTPVGTNAPSAVTFTGQTDANFVNGFDQAPVLPSFQEGAYTPASLAEGFYTAGSAAQFTEGAFTPAEIQAGFVTAGVAPSFVEGAFTPAEIQSGFVTAGVAPSYTEGAFSAGTLASLVPAQSGDGLVFNPGVLPSKAADTFSAGSPTVVDTTKFSGGSKAADTWSAGSPTVVDVTKFDGGSKASDTFVANTPAAIDITKFNGGSKAADTFSAGTAPTLATAKAITAVGTAEAAAQVFTGTEATIVSD